MKLPRYIEHLTLDTGHTRRSPRSEVADQVVEDLRPVLAAALATPRLRAPLWVPGWKLSATAEGRSALIATVWIVVEQQDAPIVTFGVARDSRSGAGLWPILCRGTDALDRRPPAAPWLAARLEVGAGLVASDDLVAVGDLERCVAWSWLETPVLQTPVLETP